MTSFNGRFAIAWRRWSGARQVWVMDWILVGFCLLYLLSSASLLTRADPHVQRGSCGVDRYTLQVLCSVSVGSKRQAAPNLPFLIGGTVKFDALSSGE
jgi:hypothetical protein